MYQRNLKIFFIFIPMCLLLLSFSTGCFLDSGSETAVNLKSYDQATLAGINQMIESDMQAGSVPGAIVGIWNEGYETLLIAKGKADAASGRAALATDRFRIASNSKMFTAKALLMLADEKKIALDDKVSIYLPEIPYADQISIRQLANHTSGYPDYSVEPAYTAAIAAAPLRVWAPKELIDFVKNKPLDFTPGTQYSYCNSGYIIMGMIIEKVSKQKWADYITAKLLRPLSMTDSSCPLTSDIPGEHMNGYLLSGTIPVEVVLDPSIAWSAGGIVSTVTDMKKWLDELVRGTLITPAMLAEQKKDPGAGGDYGFGVTVGAKYTGHTGSFPGYSSCALITHDGKQAIVMFCNTSVGNPGPNSAVKLAKYVFEGK